MPKHHKTSRVELWRTPQGYQDTAGAWHQERPTQLATWWADIKGHAYDATFETASVVARPSFDITITRPKFTQPRIGDHIRHQGRFYAITQINELSGQVGHDMRLTCVHDEDFGV